MNFSWHRRELSPRRLITIFREEGPAALYKGFVPKVLRLAPGGGVLLLVVEFTLGVFRKGMSLKTEYVTLTLLISLLSDGSAVYLR
jgi:Mitochondrial carrier protein